MRFKILAAAVMVSTVGVATTASAAHHKAAVGHRHHAPAAQRRPSPKAQRARELHLVGHRLEPVEVAEEVVGHRLQLGAVEGQTGAVDGLLRFRTCVSSAIVDRGTAQHGAARPVRAA
jgi:hypothetical protein